MLKKSLLLFILILGLGYSNTSFAVNCDDYIDPEGCKEIQAEKAAAEKAAAEKAVQDDIDNQAIVDNETSDVKAKKIASAALAKSAQKKANEAYNVMNTAKESWDNCTGECTELGEKWEEARKKYITEKDKSDIKKEAAEKLKDKYDDSSEAEGDIASKGFEINVDKISPGMKVNKDNNTTQNVNYVLGTIIQTLMIALGSLSLVIMTVGAGYIVLHSGQDELLSKGKSIFMSGIYALVVALGSYYIVTILRYILYT